MRVISLIFLFVLILLGITFAGLNAELVQLNYYIGQISLPVSMLVVFSIGVGLIIGLFLAIMVYFRLRRRNYKLNSKLRMIEKELENLRSIPLRDS